MDQTDIGGEGHAPHHGRQQGRAGRVSHPLRLAIRRDTREHTDTLYLD